MLFLLITALALALAWQAARRLERTTPDWTEPPGKAHSLLGALFAFLTAADLFAVTTSGALPSSRLRVLLLGAVALAALPALWFALRATNPGAAALWRAFAVTMLVLSCVLGVVMVGLV